MDPSTSYVGRNEVKDMVRTRAPRDSSPPPCFLATNPDQSGKWTGGCSSAQNTATSDPSTWNCPSPPKLAPAEKATNAASILKAMGVGQCVDQTYAGGAFSIWDLMGGFAESSNSVGCEQVSVITDSYNSTFTAVNCALTKITNTVNMSDFAVNSVAITTSGHGKLFCGQGGLNINQSINLKMFYTGTFTANVQNQTTTNVQNYIQAIQSSMLKADVGWGATPQGQRAISQVQAQIQNYINTTDLTQIASNIVESFYTGNTIAITISDYSVVEAGDCDISQNGTYDLVVQNIFTTATTNVTSNTALNSFIANQSNSLSSTAAGFSLGGFGIGIIILIVVALFFLGGPLIFAKKLGKLSWPLLLLVTLAAIGFGIWLHSRGDRIASYFLFGLGGLSFLMTIFAFNKYQQQQKKEKAKQAASTKGKPGAATAPATNSTQQKKPADQSSAAQSTTPTSATPKQATPSAASNSSITAAANNVQVV